MRLNRQQGKNHKGGNMKNIQRKNGIIKKAFIGMFVCLALIFGAAQAQAKDILMGEWWHSTQQATALGLTSIQIAALDDLYANNYGPISSLKGTLKADRQGLKGIFGQTPLNTQELINQLSSMESTREQLGKARLAYMEGMINILTPDQFQQLHNMMKKGHGKVGHGSWDNEQ
jgi:Spy/CpxP family protein refolding chaperone